MGRYVKGTKTMRHSSSAIRYLLLCTLTLCGFLPAHALAQSADLGVTKSGPTTAVANSDVVYTVTVENSGPDDAANVVLSDPVPAGMTYVSVTQSTGPTFTCDSSVTCTLGSLPKGASATFAVTLHIPAGTAAGTLFLNTASVSSATPDDNDENNSAVWGVQLPPVEADLAITKSGPSNAAANTDITYTITLSNLGPDAATGVSWTDSLPAPLTFVSLNQTSGPTFSPCTGAASTTCAIASLPAATTATFNLVAHVPAGTASGTSFTNFIHVSSDNDPNGENDNSSVTTTVSSADVAIAKSGSASAVAGGAPASYTITLSNNGPDPASVARFSDALPAGMTFVSLAQNTGPSAVCSKPPVGANGTVACSIALLGNGANAQFTLQAAVAADVANGTVLTNTAVAATDSIDTNSANDSASANTTVIAQADLAASKSGPASVVAGTNATYTLGLTNNGPSNAASATLSDTLPTGTTFVSLTQTNGPAFTCTTPAVGAGGAVNCSAATLAVDDGATFTLVVAVASDVAAGTTLTNTATVQTTSTDTNSGNNSAVANTSVTAAANLSLSKTAASAIVPPGGNIVYTLGIANGGPSAAASVTLSDPLPAGTHFVALTQTSGPAFACTPPAVGSGGTLTCTIASLANGASASFQLTVDTVGLPQGGVSNTASVTSATTDPVTGNNSASADVRVAPPAVPAPALGWQMLLLMAALIAAMGWRLRRAP